MSRGVVEVVGSEPPPASGLITPLEGFHLGSRPKVANGVYLVTDSSKLGIFSIIERRDYSFEGRYQSRTIYTLWFSLHGTTKSKQHLKVADPPKYKKNKSDLTLKQWLQKLSIWFRYQNITLDEDKIIAALMFIEGGVQSFMDDYTQKAANGTALST